MKQLVGNLHASLYVHERIAAAGVNGFVGGRSCIEEVLHAVHGAADADKLTM